MCYLKRFKDQVQVAEMAYQVAVISDSTDITIIVVIGIGIGALVIVISVIISYFVCRKKGQDKPKEVSYGLQNQTV